MSPGWRRIAPYPGYVIWHRVRRFRRPGKRSAAEQYTRHRAAFVPDGARALSGYVIWRRVRPLRRPGKRSAAGQSGRVPVFVQYGG
ncbi:hypothetical protein V2U99_18815 [Klebsiella variicola]